MKKISLVLVLFGLFALSTMAQNNNLVSANNFMKYGDLDKAKEKIDLATVHPKTEGLAKTWFYRGEIYFEISRSKKFKSLDPNADEVAFNAFKKALVLNFESPENKTLDLENNVDDMVKFYQLIKDPKTKYHSSENLAKMLITYFPSMGNHFAIQGDSALRITKEYKNALDDFEKVLFLSEVTSKTDTVVFYYAAFAAEKAKDYTKAKEYYKKLAKLHYGKDDKERASMYYYWANVNLMEGDTVAFLDVLQKGKKAYPNESILLIQEINHYITLGQPVKAENMIKTAIEKDPNNKLLHFNIGTIYESTERYEEAEQAYLKAIEVDSLYFDAVYNVGALYFNQGVDILKEANNLPLKDKKYEPMKKEAFERFNKSLPYLEKAYVINKEDMNTVNTLRLLYARLDKMEKAEEFEKIYKELKSK